MGSIHASGVSFDGKGFDRINTVNPWVFETTIHLREKINNWNMSVQEWLRKCIYQRSSIKNRTLRQLYVFGISSFWHGFYPAYYITFGLWFIQMHIHTAAFKYFKSGKPLLAQLYNRSGIIGNIILANLVMFLFSHIATYFLILDTDSCWRLMKSLYFTPQIILVVLAVVFTFLPVPREKGAKK
jgi:lysophospholipid acyltransferase